MDPIIGRGLFIGLMIVFAGLMGVALIRSIRAGRPVVSVGLVLMATAYPMFFTWLVVQKGSPSGFSLGSVSYAAVAGDLFVLTTAAALAATAWKQFGKQVDKFWTNPLWVMCSLGFGGGLGAVFHMMGGQANSQSAVRSEQLHDSATSWAHNVGVFPAVAGALICTIVPLFTIAKARSWAIGITAIVVAGWGGLVAVDTIRMQLHPKSYWHFDPHWLDVPMDWSRWTVRT